MSTYLFVSIVDIVMGGGLAGVVNNAGNITGGMAFASTLGGKHCAGARGYWAGGAATLKISLWRASDNVRVAVGAVTVSGPGLWVAYFNAYALVTGQAYGITAWDISGGHYTSYNGATSGTAPMGDVLPAGLSTGPAMIGPGVEVTFYSIANSGDDRYGIAGGGDAAPVGNVPGVWYPIEPIVY